MVFDIMFLLRTIHSKSRYKYTKFKYKLEFLCLSIEAKQFWAKATSMAHNSTTFYLLNIVTAFITKEYTIKLL